MILHAADLRFALQYRVACTCDQRAIRNYRASWNSLPKGRARPPSALREYLSGGSERSKDPLGGREAKRRAIRLLRFCIYGGERERERERERGGEEGR